MNALKFNTEFDPRYGELVQVADGLRRIVAPNPGPFTFKGTGTYVVGHGEVAVVDPGPMLPDHVDRLLEQLDKEVVSHILVTHTHSDHSPASPLLKARTGAPVLAFGPHATPDGHGFESGTDRDFTPDFELDDLEVIAGGNWELTALHTPGHCSNHLCFAWGDHDLILCGDQLMAWSTTVILPPDGSLSAYLGSLKSLRSRPESVFWPTHGAEIRDPKSWIDQIISHREDRVTEVLRCLNEGATSLSQIRQIIYTDISPSLYTGAELSILASIEYLVQLGKVVQTEDGLFSPTKDS
ncbi:MAG: MBL fold metallo-hydrolase [Pseudomonadota bacterium]